MTRVPEPLPAPRPTSAPAAYVRAGSHVFALEPDQIHLIGSGERAHLRLVHESIAPAHATLCAHAGQLIVEDLGTPGGTWLGDDRIVGERQVPAGSVLRVGGLEIRLTDAPPLPVAHRPAEPSFGELMSGELRRAPWFVLSALLHAIAVLLVFLLTPAVERLERGVTRVQIAPGERDDLDQIDISEPDVEIRVPETSEPVPPAEPDPVEEIEAEPAVVAEAAPPSQLSEIAAPGVSLFTAIGGAGKGDVLRGAGDGGLPAGFRKTVTGLRATGLEIVFVLDTTGSMGPVLDATKKRMVRMLEVLHALVPDARVGIVAYRDRGPGEQYVTRSLGLDRDLYRSLNFMQTMAAGGGGDRPEAVHEGLRTAIEQRWRDGAKRVVVVVGDAPAHAWAADDIARLVRNFVRDGRGFVHTITTSAELLGTVSRDTMRSFESIAQLGHGLCVTNEAEGSILEQVLALAIGPEFRESIDAVFRIVETRTPAFSTRARDAVRRRDPDAIALELRHPTVEDGFVQALIDAGDLKTVDALILALKTPDLPTTGRHAAAYALQRILRLREPPIDPLDPRPLDGRGERDLRAVASRLR